MNRTAPTTSTATAAHLPYKSLQNESANGWTIEGTEFRSRHAEETFRFSTGLELNNLLHLVPSLKCVDHTSTPSDVFMSWCLCKHHEKNYG